ALRDLQSVRRSAFAPRYLPPSCTGLVLPHVSRPRVRGREAALGKRDHAVEAVSRKARRASDPRQGWRRGPRVHLEHLDRLPRAVMDDIQCMHGALPRFEIETVSSESIRLLELERTGTRGVGGGIEPFVPCRGREQHRRGLVAHVDEMESTALTISGGN